MTCPECSTRWLDDRTSCDHKVYQDDAGKYEMVPVSSAPEEGHPPASLEGGERNEVPAGFVPSLADFETMAVTMDRQVEVHMLVAGEVMRGKQVGAYFVPSDREGLRNALENSRDTMNDVRGQD